jgi:ppGpp synthetase/RelA/SpoT-type nucleotidyltranferase
MAKVGLNQHDRTEIADAVAHFVDNRHLFEAFAQALIAHFRNNQELSRYIHFIKYRIKDPEHLRSKLERKVLEGKRNGVSVGITASNLFEKVTDLAGIRLLHLHTEQMRHIHRSILAILEEQQLRLIEKPTANCWDIEYENLFKEYGINTRSRDSMYTTVHYVIEANQKTKITCELQVRTLMDEAWGEVSHKVNYPAESTSEACRSQLKVLARLTTGCTRLVDSIFRSHQENNNEEHT